jgi:hypothetical protein
MLVHQQPISSEQIGATLRDILTRTEKIPMEHDRGGRGFLQTQAEEFAPEKPRCRRQKHKL